MPLKIKDKKNNVSVKPKKNLTVVVASALGVVVFSGLVWFSLSQLLATESYYILNQDLAAKTLVTTEMLTKVETAKGTAPKNAITASEVSSGTVFTKIPLETGDVLVPSNTGLNIDSSTGIPDDWSVTSFTVERENAVNGNISRGQYFDVIGVKEGTSKYIATSLLALDVDSGAVDTQVDESSKSTAGSGSTITIVAGMPAKDVSAFQAGISTFESEKVTLALSPKSISYETRDTSDLQGLFTYDSSTKAPDLYEGTDNTFSAVKRDKDGRPISDSKSKESSNEE